MTSLKHQHSRLWSIAIAFLMAAQLALAFHGHDHQSGPPQSDECALCHVVSNMAPGPTASPIATPEFDILVRRPVSGTPLLRVAALPAGFHARAPPMSVSV